MTVKEQSPAMDAALAKMDKRIFKAYATIEKLEERGRAIGKRVERVRRYAGELGRQRSVLATYELNFTIPQEKPKV